MWTVPFIIAILTVSTIYLLMDVIAELRYRGSILKRKGEITLNLYRINNPMTGKVAITALSFGAWLFFIRLYIELL